METNVSKILPFQMNNVCRFCLKSKNKMRHYTAIELARTQIPHLFESITSRELEIADDYPKFVCVKCEENIKLISDIRRELLLVDDFWKKYLYRKPQLKDSEQFIIEDIKIENSSFEADSLHIENDDSNAFDYLSIEPIEDEKDIKLDPMDEVYCTEVIYDDDNIEFIDDPLQKMQAEAGEVADASSSKSNTEIVKKVSKTVEEGFGVYFCKCDICNKKCPTLTALKTHMQIHLPKTQRKSSKVNNSGVCHICGKTNLKRLKEHLLIHRHAGEFKCDYCGYGFSRKTALIPHFRTHTGHRPCICDICGNSYSYISALQRHKKTHIPIVGKRNQPRVIVQTDQKIKCEFCNIVYIHNRSLAVHLRKVHGIDRIPNISERKRSSFTRIAPRNQLKCTLCDRSYSDRGPMMAHFIQGHNSQEEWDKMLATVCMKCFKVFDTPEELDAHKSIHLAFQCEICMQRYSSQDSLYYHSLIHKAKNRPYKCRICGSAQTTKSNLNQHFRRAHTNDRPFVCNVCGKGFSQGFELTGHVKTVHEKERRFKCDHCPKTFLTSSRMHVHKRLHTGVVRYRCDLCEKNFTSGWTLSTHNRTYHFDATVIYENVMNE